MNKIQVRVWQLPGGRWAAAGGDGYIDFADTRDGAIERLVADISDREAGKRARENAEQVEVWIAS